MRQIKASEIKPGMTIRWTHNKVTYECPVMDRDGTDEDGGVLFHVSEMHSEYVDAEAGEVTVLSEPQPEEPTEFGAKVVAGGATALRTQDGADEVDPREGPWRVRSGRNTWDAMTWAEVCALGQVTVVPDQGWAVPTETPEVPDRIEEWPEDDTALRDFVWRDRHGQFWL